MAIPNRFVAPRSELSRKVYFSSEFLDWSQIWSDKKYYVMDGKNRNMWFELKHRILPTKDKLKSWGITQDDACPLCNCEVESLEHLFIYCATHVDACLFAENIIRKCTENATFSV